MDKYYDLLSRKGDFGSVLSGNFLLTGTVAKESRGKSAYVSNAFFKGVKRLKVKRMIVAGDSACAIVNYDLASPKGNKFNADVAEVWEAKNGELDSVAIYFDTAFFQRAMA